MPPCRYEEAKWFIHILYTYVKPFISSHQECDYLDASPLLIIHLFWTDKHVLPSLDLGHLSIILSANKS